MSDDLFPEFQHKPPRTPNYKERVRMGLQKGGLRNVAKSKASNYKQYLEMKIAADDFQHCFCHKIVCIELNQPVKALTKHKEYMHPHHENGRDGDNILDFKWVCWTCHQWIHANADRARELKLLFI